MKLTTLIVAVLLPGVLYASTLKMMLSEALKDNSIKMEAVNFAGSFQGKTTRLNITNNTRSMIQVTVDIGTILKPEDSTYQPMVLAGSEVIVIMPGASSDAEVQTFCGNAPRHCPRPDLRYSFLRIGNDTLVKVLTFIHDNNLFDDLGQHAVWMITNHNPLGAVYDPERAEVSKKLIALLVQATGSPQPGYYMTTTTEQVPDEPAYVPKNLKIYADFEIILDAPKILTLGVYDSTGKMAQPVFENQEFGKSGHRFNVEFEAENVAAGTYYIRLKEGNAVLKETAVNVE